jgi:hypothetical protein
MVGDYMMDTKMDIAMGLVGLAIAIIIGFMVVDKVETYMMDVYNFCENKDGMWAYGGEDDMAFNRDMVNCTSMRSNETVMLASNVMLVTNWMPIFLCLIIAMLILYYTTSDKNVVIEDEIKNSR